jgi:hypothetical protein
MYLHNLECVQPTLIHHGLTTVLRLVAHKAIMNSEIIVLNVQHHYSLTQSMANANHAHKDISSIQLLIDANAQFPVLPQDPLIQQTTNVNAQLIQKAPEEFGTQILMLVTVHLISHYGMVNIVLYAQQILSMTQMKDNVITAQKDLFDILPVTIASLGSEQNDSCIEFMYFIDLRIWLSYK